jgi:energy-coupling factor transport system permease protein
MMSLPSADGAPRRSSWLHGVHPAAKIAWLVTGFVVPVATYHPVPLALIIAGALLVALSAGVLGRLLVVLLAFAPLAASIVLIQLVLPGGCWPTCEPLASLGPLTLHREGVAHGLSLVARLGAMQTVAFTLILATAAPDVIAALDALRVLHWFSLPAALTLQLVPTLRRELAIVLVAQRARGLQASGPVALARALVPVIVATVERAEQQAISLESRGFGGSTRRTLRRDMRLRPLDGALVTAAIGAGVAGTTLGLTRWGRSSVPAVEVAPEVAIVIALGAIGVLLAMLARVLVVLRRT